MKRFILFAGLIYYAKGGVNDLIGFYDTILEAVKDGNAELHSEEMDSPEWFHIFDTETGRIVARSDEVPWGN